MEYIAWEALCQVQRPGVMLLPTDTVYGLHACVDDSDAVSVLQTIKERDDERYFIALISQWEHLEEQGIVLEDKHLMMLEQLWPGPYTVLFRDDDDLTRSFRWPDQPDLLSLIDQHGPLYSTSANWHGEPTIISPDMVDNKLGSLIDYAVDQGALLGQSSTIIEIIR